jgi:hypothetical protein
VSKSWPSKPFFRNLLERCLLEADRCESRAPIVRTSALPAAGKALRADQGRGAQLEQRATGFTSTPENRLPNAAREELPYEKPGFLSAAVVGCLLALYSHRTPAVMAVPYGAQELFWRLLA